MSHARARIARFSDKLQSCSIAHTLDLRQQREKKMVRVRLSIRRTSNGSVCVCVSVLFLARVCGEGLLMTAELTQRCLRLPFHLSF